jgi:hypothetical protein
MSVDKNFFSYVREGLLPSGEYTGTSLFYSLLRRAPGKLQILPKPSDDLTARIMKGVALFIASFALNYFAFFGAVWHAWGAGINGSLYFICDLLERESLLGIEKYQLHNNLKTCLIQGLFGFTLSTFSWCTLGAANGAFAIYSYLTGNYYGLEHLQYKVTEQIQSIKSPPTSNNFFSFLF